jgi:multiple sugar transport system ATP-binding protein
MNLLRARVYDGALVIGRQRLLAPIEAPDVEGEVVVGVRPEAVAYVPDGLPEPHALEASVLLVESLGSDLLVHAELDAPAVLTGDQLEVAREVGADRERARLTARLTPDVPVVAGDRVRLRVDVDRMHYFDPDTTLALT